MEIVINEKKYEASEGETVLDVCRRENIPVPMLCAHGKLKREAVCRLCLVEIGGRLVTSCTTNVNEGLEVITESEKIKKAREINMELLWSDHAGKCVKCKRNRHCELQSLAEEYKIDNFHFVPRKEDLTNEEELDLLKDNRIRVVVDDKNPAISRTTEFCVECRRCINICPTQQYGFNNRAGDVVVGTPYEKTLDCIFCGACVKHCPTAALTDKNNLEEIQAALDDIKKMAVAIIDPAVMESAGNEFSSVNSQEKLAGILKELGYEKIFALDYGLEKYVEKIAEELTDKKDKKILFNSHCAAFDLQVKKYYPEFSKNLSKIPVSDELMAEHLKTEYAKREKINPDDMIIFSISSCTAKKALNWGKIDYYLTVRELGRLARKKAIDIDKIKETKIEKIENEEARDIIKSGGLLAEIKKRIKKEESLKVISANTVPEIKKLLDDIRKKKVDYDFVECMVCPGGCINGGGQSINIKE
jgi:NADH dehydrogenase/NADH:ubiquinone oxidoreductase subunit G